MNAHTKRISVFKLISINILCGFLVACGGSNGDDDIPEQPEIPEPNGIRLDSSNYEASFQTAAIDTSAILRQLMTAGDEIEFNDLEKLSQIGNTTTFACHNQGGLIKATVITANTAENTVELIFTNCTIYNSGNDRTTYNGISTINEVIHSGQAVNFGSLYYDWGFTQNITMSNFSQNTSKNSTVLSWPKIVEGLSVSNGTIVVESSNNTASRLRTSTLTSSNLEIATTDTSGILTSRQFSSLFYDTLLDDSFYRDDSSNDNRITEEDLDYSANITGLGQVNLTTINELTLDQIWTIGFNQELISGSAELNTGVSLLKITGTGNDNVDIFLDPENDGTLEAPIATTWVVLSDS